MEIARRVVAAVVAALLVFVGQLAGLLALFGLSSGGDGDLWSNKKPNFGLGLVAGSISMTVIVAGFGAAAVISRNSRPFRATLLALGVFVLGLTGAAIGGGVVFDEVGVCLAIAVAILAGGQRAGEEGAANGGDRGDPKSPPLPEATVWRATIVAGVLAAVGLIAAISSAMALDYTVGGSLSPYPDPAVSLAFGVLSLIAFVAAFAAAARLSKHPDPLRATLIALAVVAVGLAAGALWSSAAFALFAVGIAVAVATRCASRGLLVSRIVGVAALSMLAPATLSSSTIAAAPLLVALAVPITDHFVARKAQHPTSTTQSRNGGSSIGG